MGPRSQCHLTTGCSGRRCAARGMCQANETSLAADQLLEDAFIESGAISMPGPLWNSYTPLGYAPLRNRSWQIGPSGENVS